MSFNQESKSLSQDVYLVLSLDGNYVPYMAKPEPVYGQKYENYNRGDNKNYDPEKARNLDDDNLQEIERLKLEQTQRYLDQQSSVSCPPWIGRCFSIFCFCFLRDICTSPTSMSTTSLMGC